MSCREPEFRLQVRQDRPVVLDAELSCRGGELLALVGPSGSGKTSLLRMIAGLSRPATGQIFCGEHTWLDSASGVNLSPQRRRVGYVPQHYGLFPHLSALANIESGLGHLPSAVRARCARDWLAKMHLTGLEQRRPAELSGGEQQRVALARALAREPSILLLDEPFSAVDRALRDTLYLELAELKQELSLPIIMVTHDLGEALLLADRMTLLDQGRSLQSGVPGEVMRQPVSAAAARLMGLRNVLPGRLLRHEPQTQTSWIECGDLQLPTPYRPEIAAGAALDWVLPNRAVRLAHASGESSPDEPMRRVALDLIQIIALGESVRLSAKLEGCPKVIHLQFSRRGVQELGLRPGDRIEVILQLNLLHLMPKEMVGRAGLEPAT